MAGFFMLLATMPILYGFYGVNTATYAMQTSWLQTVFFLWFLFSLLCTTLMLPCGRYYYDIEAGYVGNPWVKMSYQYIYLYLGWLVYHLDAFEAYLKRNTEAYLNE
jgi:membrane protein insertase Oxa1/YidC/SpoIIIJ